MIKRFAPLKLDIKNCFIPSENFKNVKNILFYFVKYMRINISTVRRLARDLGVGMVRGGTERRVMFIRSYCAVILLPRFVQAGSCEGLFFTLYYFLKSYREECQI